MAIDYRKEWKKLHESTGHCTVVKNNTGTTLNVIMDTQIRKTIDVREVLMKEYLESGMHTDITGGNQYCHFVNIGFYKSIFGNLCISKKDFAKWCEKKGGK